MKREYVIKNAIICDPSNEGHGKTRDVLIEKGIIKSISSKPIPHKTIIEADKAYLSPAWTDIGTQFRDPGLEHKETIENGIKAAAAGGYTNVAIFPNTQPVIQSKESIAYVTRLNHDNICQVRAIAAITKDTNGTDLTEMIDLAKHGAIAFSDGENPIQNADIILKSLQYVYPMDGLIIQRPENNILNAFGTMHEGIQSTMLGLKGMPPIGEETIVARDLQVLEYAGGKLHFHKVSTARSIDMIRKAKKKGLAVSCDIGIAYLLYTDSDLSTFNSNLKVNPPFRTANDIKAMMKGLKDGTIDCIVSAHEPHNIESKDLEFDLADFGIASIQTVLPKLLAAFEDPLQIPIHTLSNNPRTLLGLDPIRIKEGEKAECILFDAHKKWTLNHETNHSTAINDPQFGEELIGKILYTINGQEVFSEN